MKRKNVSSQEITKADLESALEKYATKEDIKLNTEEILSKVDENARKYKDEILAKMDEVMGELGVMREENTIGSHQTSQLQEEVDGHEKRIKHLEKISQTA